MSFFQKPVKSPAFDQTEGNPNAGRGLQFLATGNGASLGALYAELAPADRMHFAETLGAVSSIGTRFPDLSEHASLGALLGGLRTIWAHRLRGGAVADATSSDQAYSMFDMAGLAYDVLGAAADRTPEDSCIYGFSVRCLMMTGANPDEFTRLSERLKSCGESNVYAALMQLNYLAPKWHGSSPEMHRFADQAIAEAPNAAFIALKARAWIEQWLFETAMSEAPGAAKAFNTVSASSDFRRTLAQLDDAFYAGLSAKPGLTAAETHFARNAFAVLFTTFEDKARLKPHLEAIGSRPSFMPWAYASGADIPGAVSKWRRSSGLKAL